MEDKRARLPNLERLICRLKQSYATISIEDISQLNLTEQQKSFIFETIKFAQEAKAEIPESQLVREILDKNVPEVELEEICTHVNIMLEAKRRKIDNQYVTNQFNFFTVSDSNELRAKSSDVVVNTMLKNLCQAFSSQHIEQCRQLLNNYDLRYIDHIDEHTGDTALIRAIHSAKIMSDVDQAIAKINLLFSYSTNVNAINSFDSTALHIAAKFGFKELCELLINRGADLFLVNKGSETPIHTALINNHIVLAMYLFDRLNNEKLRFVQMVDMDHKNTLLHFSVRKDEYIQFTRHIIPYSKVIIEQRNGMGQTPLLCAIYYSSHAATLVLIENNSSTMAVISEYVDNGFWASNIHLRHTPYFVGATVLHLVGSSLVEHVLLRSKVPDINDCNNPHRCTPLHSAVLARSIEKVIVFYQYGASLDFINDEGHNAAHLAAINPSLDILFYLLTKCPKLMLSQDKYGMTPLHWAILKKHDLVSLIIYMAHLFNLHDQLLQLKSTASNVVVMGEPLNVKGKNYQDLFRITTDNPDNMSSYVSSLVIEGDSLVKRLRLEMRSKVQKLENKIEDPFLYLEQLPNYLEIAQSLPQSGEDTRSQAEQSHEGSISFCVTL